MKISLTSAVMELKDELEVLDAKHVYLLMKKDYRISRNARAQWFFSNLNCHIRLEHHENIDDFHEELSVISVIPCRPPSHWYPENAHQFTYRLLSSSMITFLARRYRLVFCLDLSPSIMVVDAKSGEVVLDSMVSSLRKCLDGLTADFIVPGTPLRYAPQLYVTVIAHSSSFLCPNQQVVVQGWRLTSSNLNQFLSLVVNHLMDIENFLFGCSSYLQQRSCGYLIHSNHSSNSALPSPGQISSEKSMDFHIEDDDSTSFKSRVSHSPTSFLKSPETGYIDLLRYGILALQLLPENTSAGIAVVTDGVINVPDIHVFQSLLTQLRNSTISCSFLHVSSSRDPRCCWGYAPFTDLMRFIATATYGAYLPHTSSIDLCNDDAVSSMNIYHQGMFSWSFQWAPYVDKVVYRNAANVSQNSIFPFNGINFSLKEDFHLETKKHVEKHIATSLQTLLSCRLREGYAVQQVSFKGNRLEVSMLLPWKHDVNISYVASSTWPPDGSMCHHKVVVNGSYEFLHDLTCPTKKPIKSVHRSSVVKKFFEALQQLSQTDDLLTHLHSFASNPIYYMIPESMRNGVPLFHLPSGSSRPVLSSSDLVPIKFAEFWEPICLLDINIWQKWMHAHRIGLLLVHDKPLPRHLHAPNSNGRYTAVQCRQALSVLDNILADFTSFVLVENHSYIKLLFGESDKPPISFVIIRVISHTPYVVIRLAFLGGTQSQDRVQIFTELKRKILASTLPLRGNLKTSNNLKVSSAVDGGSASDIAIGLVESDCITNTGTPCCVPLLKPVEKLLIRYERTPRDYTNPSERHTRPGIASFNHRGFTKSSTMHSTLGHYLHHKRWVWSAQCDPTVDISLNVISRILATLVKIRLKKGFHVAHSHSGILNLVLEVQMKIGAGNTIEEDELYPCVLQYVLFPPHIRSSSPESLSEDELEPDLEPGEVNGKLELITECWVEPQHGRVARTTTYGSETEDLEGLTFRDLPDALFAVDMECISTMLTFEHLNVMCNGDASFLHVRPQISDGFSSKATVVDKFTSTQPSESTSTVCHVSFSYDLMRLLPRCSQAQLLFSTLAQTLHPPTTSPTTRSNDDTANDLLIRLFHDGLTSIHDREVPLTKLECIKLSSLLRPQRRSDQCLICSADVNGQPEKATHDTSIVFAKWKCYVKSLSPTHVLLTFVPDLFDDICLLKRCNDPEHENYRGELSGLRYNIPVYAADCPLSGLIADIVGSELIIRNDHDFFQDYRSSHRDSENQENADSRTGSDFNIDSAGGCSNIFSPEPRTEYSEEASSSPSDRRHWRKHAKKVAMVYSNCFVSTIYRSLRKKITVCRSDILAAMEEICIETALVIDITKFIQTICLHVNGTPVYEKMEHNPSGIDARSDTADDENVLTVPSHINAFGPCLTLRRVHTIVQSKFLVLMRQSFSPVPANKDYYYYEPSTHSDLTQPVKWIVGNQLDDMDDEDREAIQFRLEENEELTTNLDSDDCQLPSLVDDGSSDDSNIDVHSNEDTVNLPPLFVHLTCTLSDRRNNSVVNISVKTLPTCFGDLEECFMKLGWSADDKVDLNNIRVTLDVLCLTLPPELEVLDVQRAANEPVSRSTSLCSSTVKPDMEDDDDLCTINGYENEVTKDPLGHLPMCQRQAVNDCVSEINWMLKDEIASFARGLNPITEATLKGVTDHISQSTSLSKLKQGCLATHVPLQFVFGPENSLDKFIQEFQHMKLRNYRLIREGCYYYVALAGSSHMNSEKQSETSSPVGHAIRHLVVQQLNPHQDDRTELDSTAVRPSSARSSFSKSTLSTSRFSLKKSLASARWASCDDSDVEDTINNNVDLGFRKRLHSRLTRSRGNRSKSESELGNVSDSNRSLSESRLRLRKRFKATSLREESPLCAMDGVEVGTDEETMVDVNKNVNAEHGNDSVLCNDTEDGYDGDSSDEDNDGMLLGDSDSKCPQLPDFWLIMEVLPDRVDVYFQFRDTELDMETLKHHQEINRHLVSNIKSMCKLINQTLLLQDLHESRMCNQLLEPEAIEDIWRADEITSPSPLMGVTGNSFGDASGRRWSAYQPFTELTADQEENVDCQDAYLEATMKFKPGAFSCPVVWEMQFALHPRLKTGHGRSSTSRGIQALKSVLSRLSVNNRKNMFVYKERTGGAVFYLRLHETLPTQGSVSVGTGSVGNENILQQMQMSVTQKHSFADESSSLGGSQSSSMQSLNIGRNSVVDVQDELPEPRSRVNSMPEKDRLERCIEHHVQYSQLDSMSMTSRVSGRQRSVTEDVITLSVHGITETGSEIKEELVKALQGRLDDAVLDVISITLARNPMCKLTSEDIQFIQRSDSMPTDVRHFMVRSHALHHLPVVVYYLQQNLLQWLNVPKYVDNRDGSRFQRYRKNSDLEEQENPAVFLYIMPQEAGSRGIACIVLSVVDGKGNPVCHFDCPAPNPDIHMDGFSVQDFDELTMTSQHTVDEEPSRKSPGPVALIQVQIWIKGKVDLEQLVDRLRVAIKYALWDLVTEYRLLTAPLAEMPSGEDSVSTPINSEPCTPAQRVKHHSARQPITDPSTVKERGASPLFLVQALLREVSISVPDLALKCRSPTWPSTRGTDVGQQTKSPPPFADDEVHFGMDADVLRRREKYEVGEKGLLHPFYASLTESWLEYGRQIGVHSVVKFSLSLTSRYSVQLVLQDMYKLIAKLVPDITPRTFKREHQSSEAFFPFLVTGRERRKASGGSSSSEATRIVPGSNSDYIVVGRNVRQWRTSTGRLEDDIAEAVDYIKNYKELQRFSPQIQSLSNDSKDDLSGKKVFIPRQRLLIAIIKDREISIYTYNWAHDLATSLMDECSKLVELQNTRSCFLSSIVLQKLGLFLNQPGSRQCVNEVTCQGTGMEPKEKKCLLCTDIDLLLKGSSSCGGVGGSGVVGPSGSRRELNVQLTHRQRRSTTSGHHYSVSFCDVLRDAKPPRPMRQTHAGGNTSIADPVLQHGLQFLEIRNLDNRELQKQLSSMWQNRDVRICVQKLKQISRVEHYCFTPILFDPAWRLQVAAARDHTRTCTPIMEPHINTGVHSHHHHHHHHCHLQHQLSSTGTKSRHSSGASLKSPADARLQKRYSTDLPSTSGVLFSALSLMRDQSSVAIGSDTTDEWNAKMYGAFVAEFVQYLQTLGFVGFRSSRTQKSTKGGAKSEVSRTETKDSNVTPTSQHLQKILLGGIILLELVLCEPYFGVKMYTMERVRLPSLSNRVLNSQFVVAFLDECDKIKVCMHLHSFTYDYHLRSVHAYVCGRQVPGLGRDYHVLGFLDDFVQYYIKSPNFARNLVHQGSMTVGPTTGTTSRQLFNYLLKYDKLYEMHAVKMNVGTGRGGEAEDEMEHLLVQMSTHKVAYRDSSSDARQTDEFDMSLLISVDASHCDSLTNNTLNLRYYIILTSCREMYPKPMAEKQPGTFRTVVTPCMPLLPSRRPPTPPTRVSRSLKDIEDSQGTDLGPLSDSSLSHQRLTMSMDSEHQLLTSSSSGDHDALNHSMDRQRYQGSCEMALTLEQSTEVIARSLTRRDRDTTRRVVGIRQEVVNYLGYFSSHEELMHKIIMEQVDEARSHVEKIVHRAVIDCRRDSLWDKLQRNGGEVEVAEPRRRRDDFKEIGAMTYAEFTDLLSLVERKPLTEVDGRLAAFAVMPVTWYQSLVRVLLIKYHDLRRQYFTAPDGNIQHLVILSGTPSNWFVLLSIDLHSNSSELCVVCREPSVAAGFNASAHSLVEDVVNVCCFHMWTVLL